MMNSTYPLIMMSSPDKVCPILGDASPPALCDISECAHNIERRCFAHVPFEGDYSAVSLHYKVSENEIITRVQLIRRALVADQWFEYVCNRPLLDGTRTNFEEACDPRQQRFFDKWNTSEFSFAQVVSVIQYVLTRLDQTSV